jgi:hypothetical protein
MGRCVKWLLSLLFFALGFPPAAETQEQARGRGDAQIANEEAEPVSNIRHDVFYTLDEALKKAFPEADQFRSETLRLDPEASMRVAKAVGHPLHEEAFNVHQAFRSGNLLGYAVVGEELGKFRPITSLVAVGTDGKVREVVVLVYRESHGGDVRRKRFLHQYHKKDVNDPIQINRDILSISGATISVRSMNAQVRKGLHVVHEGYLAREKTKA